VLGTILLLPFSGCDKAAAKPAAPKPPDVTVALPEQKKYTDFEDFTGRLQAINTIEMKARVTGYIDEVLFQDGSDVTANQPLFKIDPRPYEDEAARTASMISQFKAQVSRLESQYNRSKKLVGNGAVSQEEVEILQFQRDEAVASMHAAEAGNKTAQLNVEYSQIKAPIAGRISRRLVDPGNLVKADETPLVMIVSLDPIYAYFDVDERTVLKIRKLNADTMAKRDPLLGLKVQIATADQQNEFPIEGVVDFVDNQLDAGTGTLRLRAKVENANLLLSPGMFVRCRLPIGKEKLGLFVPESAIGSDQGQAYIDVVDGNNKVDYRQVEYGALQDGKRAILTNLKANERVIVAGLQRVKAGSVVAPKLESEVNPQSADKKPNDQKPAQPADQKKEPAAKPQPQPAAPRAADKASAEKANEAEKSSSTPAK
jgi:RND family efflux transporter MFP subunit